MRTAEGRVTTYRVERITMDESEQIALGSDIYDPSDLLGGIKMTNTFENGLSTVSITDNKGRTTVISPDGTETISIPRPDAQFGMQSPMNQTIVKTPSGLTSTMSHSSTITEISGLTVTGKTDTITINGREYITIYSGHDQMITSISPEGRESFSFFDEKGRVICDSIPGIKAIHYIYNDKGFLVETRQGNRSSSLTYNDEGYLESITDPLNQTTTMEYDSVGRVTRQIIPDDREVQYVYDPNGNLISLTPPGRPAHEFDHTPVDLTEEYMPPVTPDSAGATCYGYNLDRQLVKTYLPSGDSIVVVYDTTGCSCGGDRKPKKVIFDRRELNYCYDETTGKLNRIISPDQDTLYYTFDGSLPTSTSWSGSVKGSIEIVYNNNFQVVSQSVNGGDYIGYTYDDDGFLTSAGSLSISRRIDNGIITSTSIGDITTNYTYNTLGEISKFNARHDTSDLFITNYSLDSLGRITEIIETVQSKTNVFDYQYDLAGQLVQVNRNDTTISIYTYDDNGNRLSHTTPTATITGTYDIQDRMLSYGDVSYTYDADGYLTSKTDQSGTTYYDYDNLGNLIAVQLPDGTLIEYLIDVQNRRIGRKVDGTVVKRLIYQDQLNPVAELDEFGNVISRFVYGIKSHVPDYMVRNGEIYRFITDHLGSVRLVVNQNTGIVIQEITYDEFGNVIYDSNPSFQPFTYAGGLYDQDTKLIRFGARDYDAEAGRWTAKDPLRFGGGTVNLYEYIKNDPINYNDPTGEYNWWLLIQTLIIEIIQNYDLYSYQKQCDAFFQRLRQIVNENRMIIREEFHNCITFCRHKLSLNTCFDYDNCEKNCRKDYYEDLETMVYPLEDIIYHPPWWIWFQCGR